jgi:hypothetical protein
MPAKAKPAVKRASRATKPRTSPAKAKSAPKARAAPKTRAAPKPRATSKPAARAKPAAAPSTSPLVDKRIGALTGWRRDTLIAIRRLIQEADPEVTEDCKWFKASNPLGVPVWSHAGILCTGEVYKEIVKLTFMRGATLDDPRRLFNSSLDGGSRRAIDIREGETLDARAFKALVKAAVVENLRTKAP